jgi:hypothetical protein
MWHSDDPRLEADDDRFKILIVAKGWPYPFTGLVEVGEGFSVYILNPSSDSWRFTGLDPNMKWPEDWLWTPWPGEI